MRMVVPLGMGGGWVLEIDIRKFFDALDHRHLREILSRRVRDGVLLRLDPRLMGLFFFAAAFGAGASEQLDTKKCPDIVKQADEMVRKLNVLASR